VITTSLGKVFLNLERNEGVFLEPILCEYVSSRSDAILGGATVAGWEFNPVALSDLKKVTSDSVVPKCEDGTPIVLSPEQSLYLDILIGQFPIRVHLERRKRYQITCTICDPKGEKPWYANPAQIVKSKEEEHKQKLASFIVNTGRLLMELKQHPWLAVYIMQGNRMKGHPSTQKLCKKCESPEEDHFVEEGIMCPGCGEFRNESILVTCPYCKKDYREYSGEPIWEEIFKACSRFSLYRKETLIRDKIKDLYGDTLPGHFDKFVKVAEEMSPDETLLAMSHCSVVNSQEKDTLILFTSVQVVWSILAVKSEDLEENPARRSEVITAFSLPWKKIREVSDLPGGGVCLETMKGKEVCFSGFILNTRLSEHAPSFSSLGAPRAIRKMLQAYGPDR
jgi:hypothetical protein